MCYFTAVFLYYPHFPHYPQAFETLAFSRFREKFAISFFHSLCYNSIALRALKNDRSGDFYGTTNDIQK